VPGLDKAAWLNGENKDPVRVTLNPETQKSFLRNETLVSEVAPPKPEPTPAPEMGNCYLKKNQLPTTLPITSVLSSWHYQLK